MQEDLKVNIKKFSSMKASFEHADIGYCVPSSVYTSNFSNYNKLPLQFAWSSYFQSQLYDENSFCLGLGEGECNCFSPDCPTYRYVPNVLGVRWLCYSCSLNFLVILIFQLVCVFDAESIEALLTYNVILQDDEFNDTYISMDQMKLHTFK